MKILGPVLCVQEWSTPSINSAPILGYGQRLWLSNGFKHMYYACLVLLISNPVCAWVLCCTAAFMLGSHVHKRFLTPNAA